MNSGRAYLMSNLGFSAPDADDAIEAAFGNLRRAVMPKDRSRDQGLDDSLSASPVPAMAGPSMR